MHRDLLFEYVNYAECGLWILVGVFFLAFALRRSTAWRTGCLAASVAFVLFGVSDIIETRTGAWWRPWWLLLWKAACLVVFAVLSYRYLKRRDVRASE
jgi:hypothetical protein